MNYEESLQYIKECTKYGIKLGLERITEILRRLGNPEQRFPSIHIAGTNGKGSTAAMMQSVLRQAGYKTGCFTSPHLVSYRERFKVNDQMITEIELAEIVTAMVPVLQTIERDGFGNPTEFEVGTVIAFEFFARRNVDVAVIEVGMGGRFDATNVLKPILTIITHIALDHQEFLGDTLEKIAFEKAGIMKPGTPLVIGLQEPEIEDFLAGIALERKASLKKASTIGWRDLKQTEDFTEFFAEDYELVNIERHLNFQAYLDKYPGKTIYYATTKGGHSYTEINFTSDDVIMFGPETRGLPPQILSLNQAHNIRIPMFEKARSLNLSNSVAIILYEAIRQVDFPGLV